MRSKLKHTKQCSACPWLADSTNYRIHPANDLVAPGMDGSQIWPCHHFELDQYYKPMANPDHSAEFPCVGWLHNQARDGNSPHLNEHLANCVNGEKLSLRGEQREMYKLLVFCPNADAEKYQAGDGSYCPVDLEAAYSLILEFTTNEVIS